ncbi:type IV pilus twitching motility protein PilT [Vibrio splendidus]
MDMSGLLISDLPIYITTEADLGSIMNHAILIGASDIFLTGKDRIWAKIEGKFFPISRRMLSEDEVFGMLTYLDSKGAETKINSMIAINNVYEHKYTIGSGTEALKTSKRFRVHGIGRVHRGSTSPEVTLRTIPGKPLPIEAIALEEEILDACVFAEKGLILIVGATSSGKSTTLSSIINYILELPESNRRFIMAEEPIEFVYHESNRISSMVSQLQVGINIKSFLDGIENMMRMAPTDILIGEIRDKATAQACISACNTGHVVFATIHANNASQAVDRLCALFDEANPRLARLNVIDALTCVVAQRLVPTIDGKRTAIREYVVVNKNEDKKALKDNPDVTEAMVDIIGEKGVLYLTDLKRKLDSGLIDEDTYRKQKFNLE